MDFVRKRHFMIYVSHISHGSQAHVAMHHHSSENFPFTVLIVIALIATTFLLLSYYIFVIKCCLNLHHVDLLRRFSLSRRREEAFASYLQQEPEPRGLEEAAIRLIPVIHYKKEGERSLFECTICLNEFQQDEKLRVIPNCNHAFHIDCIDVWLQNNANCPLCRRNINISLTQQINIADQGPHDENIVDGYQDFVVIDLGREQDRDQNLEAGQERGNASEQRMMHKNARKLQKVISMGDECVGIREKDENFLVHPIRRSFSMDSLRNRKLYLTVEHALQKQNEHVNGESSFIEVCGGSGSAKRSYFPFGNGRSRSRNAVLPVYFHP